MREYKLFLLKGSTYFSEQLQCQELEICNDLKLFIIIDSLAAGVLLRNGHNVIDVTNFGFLEICEKIRKALIALIMESDYTDYKYIEE